MRLRMNLGARPCNASENVAYLPKRNEIRRRLHSIGFFISHEINKARAQTATSIIT
jgi:hypothetical protein